jgi:hypothetical protein
MIRIREFILNGLLAVLVAASIALSAQVWFPPEQVGLTGAREPRIQLPPPVGEGQMPDLYRPERILVQRGSKESKENKEIALLPLGSPDYARVWRLTQGILTGLRALAAPTEIDEPDVADSEVVTLVLPLSLTLTEWADRWHWNTFGPRNPNMKIDRVYYRLGQTPAIDLSGPTGQFYRLGGMSASDQKLLMDQIKAVEPGLFRKYRPLVTKDLSPRVIKGLLVPDVQEAPRGRATSRRPDPKWEEIRYFPDLSVVRQIDEKDAQSFTDGQRLLRLGSSGLLEYRTADMAGSAPELSRAEKATKDWVDARGGWLQDLVLGWYVQEPGKTTLGFEFRTVGPFPVESAGGAMVVQVASDRAATAADRIISLRRFPELAPVFEPGNRPLITPEQAVQVAAEEFPGAMIFEAVREIHLAYLVQPAGRTGESGWVLEPAWVIQAAEERLYVPAFVQSQVPPVEAGPHTNR